MGKAKKGKRNTNDDDIDSDLEIGEQTVISDVKNKEKLKGKSKEEFEDNKKSKKSKGKSKGGEDSDIDEIIRNIEELDVSKKKSKTKKKKDSDNESETEESRKKTKSKKSKKISISEDSDAEDIKKKSKSKKNKQQSISDEDSDSEQLKKKNKTKKSKKYSISEEDSDNEDSKRKNKESKKKSKKLSISEHDSDEDTKTKTKKGKNKGKLDDDSDLEQYKKSKSKLTKNRSVSEDDNESIQGKSKKNKGKAKGDFDDIETDEAKKKKSVQMEEEPEIKKETGGKKSKKKRRKDDSDDEDLEKVLAELEAEYSGVKKEPTPEEESKETEKKKEKKSKKDNKATIKVEKDPIADALIMDDDFDDFDDEGVGGTVKTAAQKKKEKKERERAKKMAEKQKVVKKQDSVEKEIKDKDEPGDAVTETKEKKKKKEDEKDKKKGVKGPDKKTIAAMQEALRKMKEEEERLKREEEERLRREEEAEKQRLEQLRIEQERKEKKKQKEKERKERRKAEGKLLTPKQKLERARAQEMVAMLEEQRKQLLRAQGIEVDEQTEARKPRPGTRIKPNKLKKESSQEKSIEEQKPAETDKTTEEKQPAPAQEEKVKKKDEVKDAWDADSSEEDDTEQTPEVTKDNAVASKKEPTPESKKTDEDEEEEEDDESDTESDEDDEEEESSSEEESEDSEEEKQKISDAARKRERALERIQKRREEAEKNRTLDDLRAAVVCVLGHVDTGKTKILDKLRRTNVQDGEAGGITQQIGATNVPIENIKEQTKIVKGFADKEFKLPGLLIIDTPGHESFSNLRSRGSSLCDIAILVVDIMHGLEPQTIESINLLKQRKTPFIVALNKIDRLYDWQTMNRKDVTDIIKAQAPHTQLEFENRTKEVIVQFAEQGLNAALFYSNPDPKTYISLVPTSAITGEGMGNLLALIVDMCQMHLAKRLMYSSELQATVLEVKAIPGLGTTIDVILVNGILREGDTIILAGTDGPIVTQIRSLLMPQPMRELRVKNAYIEYKEVRAAQGVKIAAKELEKAIAGLNLQVAHHPDEVEILKEEVARELKSALSSIKLHERGVFVQASTLGSLEALLEFLKASKIPYAGIRIGPVVKRDVMKASTMLEHDSQYATILAFDVKIERDAQELADSLGVKIFQADIIYHLFDKFTAYREELKQRKRDEFKHIAVFPCKLRVLPQFVFNSRDPIVCGVMVEAGILKEGTPICVPSKDFIDLGIVTSIESNHKPVESARKGQEVCIKIEPIPGESPKMFGRHFDETDMLVSKISRQSIDACKDYFRDDLIKTDWQLMVELKKLFQIL